MNSEDYAITESLIYGLRALWVEGKGSTLDNLSNFLQIRYSVLEEFLLENPDIFIPINLRGCIEYYVLTTLDEAMKTLIHRRNTLKLFETCMM